MILLLLLYGLCASFTINGIFHDKWIVVTTVQYPTEAMRKLAQLNDWQLLVIGDKKTPSDWYLDEKCIYLSIKDQEQLPYSLCKLLPYNHYSRKNIGYLYAIAHGAKIIYETDDDNYIVNEIKIFREKPTVTLESDYPVINIFNYFGQNTIWPRGYPLSFVTKSHEFSIKNLTSQKKIIIEQGLVDKEPDLDALFRLTRYDNTEIYFDKTKAPCILQDKKFCPFNTQNTLFHQEGFWGLYIPTHVPFRVCDIWRGYITQRLLWETPYTLCFTPPEAIQERNYHDLMKDFEGEQDLYLKVTSLVNFLTNWQPKEDGLLAKSIELYADLISQKFIGTQEQLLIQAWTDDLLALGYFY